MRRSNSAEKDNAGRSNLCKDFGSTHIHGTHVPVEEPSTALSAEAADPTAKHQFEGMKMCQGETHLIGERNQARNGGNRFYPTLDFRN